MNRRELLKAALLVPMTGRARPDTTIGEKDGPKRIRMFARICPVEAYGEPMEYRQAVQEMTDATREIGAVLALGKVYPTVSEPEWLTRAVESQLAEALERCRRADIQWHQTELDHLLGKA